MSTSPWPCGRRAAPSALVLAIALSLLPAGARAGTEADLGSAIRAALNVPALQNGVTAVLVQSLRDGHTLYATNPNVALVPASNAKLLTAGVALARLGKDFRFKTLLAARGKISHGVLEGDLILKGYGDPTLTTAALHDLVKAVSARGIRQVEGDILVDDSYFAAPRLGRGWAWDYLQEYYAAEVCALSLNSNIIGLMVNPSTEVGRPATLSWVPNIQLMEVINRTTTGEARSPLTISFVRAPGETRVTIAGSVPLDAQPTKLDGITVQDPALYCGNVFASLLRESAIAVEGIVRHGMLPDAGVTTLFQRQSAPLSELMPLFLKPSNNHMGEQIMQAVVARERERTRPDSPEPTVEGIVADFVKQAGADPDSTRIVDGSGLSRLNLTTTQTLVQVLRHIRKAPYGDIIVDALPVAGKDGTLSRRLRDTRAAGNLRAKTGTLDAVTNLSGFVTSASGQPLVFSILMNNFLGSPLDAHAAQDRICTLLAELE